MTVLPWHQPLLDSVRERLAAGRLPHALLVAGPEGWGEALLVNRLALELLDQNPDREACELAHPDLRWLVPEGATIKVDAVRELAEFAQGTAQIAPRKVAVVAHAHCLNANAANALLKTLEEPPGATHLLLYSAHPHRLLPTIRSRCQVLAIRPDPEAARTWLAGLHGDADLAALLFEYGGAPVAVRDALQRDETPLEGLLVAAVARSTAADAVVVALLSAGLVGAVGRWYRYALALAAGSWGPPPLDAVAPRALQAFVDELIWARRQLVTSNSANDRLIAERLVARWRQLPKAAA